MSEVARLFGLIGYPLSHSFSRKYFSEKFSREGISDAAYELFPLENIDHLPALLAEHPNLAGLNVTIPYKRAVIPFLDELDTGAAAVGAVNTIQIAEGRKVGYNTDVFGFRESLVRWLGPALQPGLKALVLGSGGAAQAVGFVLDTLNIPFRIVSRTGDNEKLTYGELDASVLETHLLIVNTTPLGMAPHTDTFPVIPYDALGEQHFLYDLVYNPEQTLFLKLGAERGCRTLNGLEMLHLQAEKAWAIWNRV